MSNIIEIRQQVGEFFATYGHLPNVARARQLVSVGAISYEEMYVLAPKALADGLVAAEEVSA